MIEPELVEKKPCVCGAAMLHFRFPDDGKEYWRCENMAKIEPDGTALEGFCPAFGWTYEQALKIREGEIPARSLNVWPEPADTRPCICGGEIVCYLENTVFPGGNRLIDSDMWICDCGAVGETYEEAISSQIPGERVLN